MGQKRPLDGLSKHSVPSNEAIITPFPAALPNLYLRLTLSVSETLDANPLLSLN